METFLGAVTVGDDGFEIVAASSGGLDGCGVIEIVEVFFFLSIY